MYVGSRAEEIQDLLEQCLSCDLARCIEREAYYDRLEALGQDPGALQDTAWDFVPADPGPETWDELLSM